MSPGARLLHRCLSKSNFIGGKNRLVQFNWNFLMKSFMPVGLRIIIIIINGRERQMKKNKGKWGYSRRRFYSAVSRKGVPQHGHGEPGCLS